MLVRSIFGGVVSVGLLLGCNGGGILPELPVPSSADLVPDQLQIRVSDPDLSFDQDWQVPNQTQWVELEVLVWGSSSEQAQTELGGETVNFTFANAREANTRALGLDQGSSCITDEFGLCRLAVRMGTEPGDWVIRATALRNPEAFADQHLVVGLGDRRRVRVEAPGLPTRNWNGSLPDPWVRDELILAQSQSEGGAFVITVYDQHDNPVPNSRIMLSVQSLAAPSHADSDAGTVMDATTGVSDAAQVATDASGRQPDAMPGESGSFDEAGVSDTGVVDGAGGSNPLGCALAACLGADAVERVEGITDEEGRFVTRLVPGASSGRFTLAVRIEEIGEDPYDFPDVVLSGKTYQRLATQIIFDGQAVCFPADTVRGAQVRLVDATGAGVANASLQIIAEGLFGASAPPTDRDGFSQITARCPSQPPGVNEVLLLRAIDVDQPQIQIDIPVAFETAAPDQLDYVPIRFDSNSIIAGSVSRLRFRVTDRNGFPVPEASVTAQPLSEADLGRLTFQRGEDFISTQTLQTNASGEVIFEVRPIGARTQPEYPLQLKVFAALDPIVRTLVPIHVLGGTPQRVRVVRGQNMQLLTGQGGATVTVRVDDGQDNPISNVLISVGETADLLMAPMTGRTDQFGEFDIGILSVLGLDDERTIRVPIQASWQDGEGVPWTQSTELVAGVGIGDGRRILLSQGGQALSICAGDPCLHLDAGALLVDPVQLQVVNANGGALRNRSIEINLIDDQPQGCGSRPNRGENLGTTGESAALFLGGDVGAEWRAGDQARSCLWEVRSGPVSQRLRLVQGSALPSLGTFQLIDTEGQLTGQASAQLALASRPLHYVRPQVFDASNSHHVELRVRDRFGNPAGLELLGANPDNCIADRNQLLLDAQGATRFRITGGADPRIPCRLSVFSPRRWQGEPPLATFAVGGGVIDVRDFVFEPVSLQSRVVRFPTVGDWTGVEVGQLRGGLAQGVVLPLEASDEDGFCAERDRCTVVELLYLGTYESLLPSPRVLCGEEAQCPSLLIKRTRTSYIVELPREHLRTTGRFGLRLFTPGQPAITSAILPIWARPIPRGVERRVAINAPQNHQNPMAVDVLTQRFDDDRVRTDTCGYSFYNDPDDPDQRLHQYRAWVASWTTGAPQASRRTVFPQSVDALTIGAKGYTSRVWHWETSLCHADDLNGDGVQDLMLLGSPRGDQHGQNCLHAVFGDANGGIISNIQEINSYCGTMPGCRLRQIGEGQTALAVLDFCDPNLPRSRRAYSVDMDGDPLDNSRYMEVSYSATPGPRYHGYRPAGSTWSLRRFGYLSQGGRLVVLGNRGRAGLMHAYPVWQRHNLDGLAWDEVVEYRLGNCEDNISQTQCSSIVQGGSELYSAIGYSGVFRLLANNRYTQRTSQGGMSLHDTATGQPFGALHGFEARSTSLSPSVDWWLEPLGYGGIYRRLMRWGGPVQEYPWADCNLEQTNGCQQVGTLFSLHWITDEVYLTHVDTTGDYVVLRHIDQPTQAYSNRIYAGAVHGYDILQSADRLKFLVNTRSGLGVVTVHLDAPLEQRLQFNLLPEPARNWRQGGHCSFSQDGAHLACRRAQPPAVRMYTFGDQSHRTVDVPGQSLGADRSLTSLGFLNNGMLLGNLDDDASLLIDPADGSVIRRWFSSTNERYPLREAWSMIHSNWRATSVTPGSLPGGGVLVSGKSNRAIRLDLSGRQADELTRTTLPGVHTTSDVYDGGDHESIVLKQLDELIIWTPQPTVPLCGNGTLDQGERCDDGNLRHDDDCPMDCRSVCGDGVRSELEACDDGNEVDGDGCNAQCELP